MSSGTLHPKVAEQIVGSVGFAPLGYVMPPEGVVNATGMFGILPLEMARFRALVHSGGILLESGGTPG